MQSGDTPLMAAVQNGKKGNEEGKDETVRLLIGFKADINLPNKVTQGKALGGCGKS